MGHNEWYKKGLGRTGLADVHPDRMLQNVASDQFLHCLQLSQQVLDTSRGHEMEIRAQLFKANDIVS